MSLKRTPQKRDQPYCSAETSTDRANRLSLSETDLRFRQKTDDLPIGTICRGFGISEQSYEVGNSRIREPQASIFPGYQAPIVRKAADGERELVVLNWGFVLVQKERAPKRVTNVRDDQALTRFWRSSIEQRRCLVPASSYCEPKGEKPAMWHSRSYAADQMRIVQSGSERKDLLAA